MLTHPPRVQNPEGEAAEGGAALAQDRKPSGASGHLYHDTPNPTLNVHCRSRSANRSQLGVEPEKGGQLHDMQQKTAGAPGKSSHTKRGSARAYLTPNRRRGRRHSSAATERNPTHICRDHQRWWPAAKTHKASYRRRQRRGE